MIVTKTPLRISFFGGGSDIPQFYNNNEGLTISTTIDKHIYIAANRCVADHLKIVYSELELRNNINDINHDRVRESLKYFNLTSNMEICSFSDVPTKGTGLGSSSTFTAGLINALHYISKKNRIKEKELAELSCLIEIVLCGEPIGKQDQYAAAYGGLNLIHYDSSGVRVERLKIDAYDLNDLNLNLLCFNTGQTRQASSILSGVVEDIKINKNIEATRTLVKITKEALTLLKGGYINDFGALLNDAWTLKKSTSDKISNPIIDQMYQDAIAAGALGGKILGAGGGGFLMMYVPENKQRYVREALKNFQELTYRFTKTGSTIEMVS